MKFRDLKPGDKLLFSAGMSLILLSLLALVTFVSVSVFSLVTWSAPHLWNLCFLLCAVSLGAWMVLYTGQLRIGGGVFLRRNNILLLFSLIVAVLTSTLVRFSGYQKLFALITLALILAAFHIAGGGILDPRMLFRLLKNERIAKYGLDS